MMKLRLGIIFALFAFSNLASAQLPDSKPPATTQETISEIPVHVKGLSLAQISSCVVIDQLPWVFRKNKRQSRLLARDRIRLSTQSDFAIWEIHQVLDPNGYVSYVFRRPLPGGRFESIVTKENHYNRILDSDGTRKIVDVRNLMPLIDRAALTFYAPDGTYAVFKPGLAGKGSFIVTYKGGTAPLFLQGPSCERVGAAGTNPYQPPAPGAAPGAANAAPTAPAGGKK